MLQVCDIKKQYKTGDLIQTALDGVSLTLRDNEFVAILGPSGSGKTTMLNVIGGLDRYDSGDLIINGISTKKYTDRDWDSYRNHTIGFVFQSYNLIPHQTVLSNVELALTISGISRSERKKRAQKALEDVGLGNQLHKKPNQMSGGQMQRVAIARALVNNPDILLADEPTGALDSETSVQVMELLKEVSKDRLVVMVTHNPELAEEYANRIVRVKDGKIVDDSNPYVVESKDLQPAKHKNMGKASMSFLTALALSFNNLRTKMGRTLLTAFAGSIGIIGIALILSLSTGFQSYIDKIQEDTLSNYPLTLQEDTADMTAAFAAFGSAMVEGKDAEGDIVFEQQMIAPMFAQVGTNDLGTFKRHLEKNYDYVADDINVIKYSYGIKPLIFSADTSEGALQVNPGHLFKNITGSTAMSMYMDSDVFKEMVDNIPLLDTQYDVLRGRWPENADERIIVLSDPHQISDYMAYTLGLKETDGLKTLIELVMQGEEVNDTSEDSLSWTYDELMSLEFRLVATSDMYRYNVEYDVWEDMSSDKAYMKGLVENGVPLKIVGIVCPKEGSETAMLSSGIAYTSALTQLVIDPAAESSIVKMQMENQETDIFTGKGFDEETEGTGLDFQEMITIDGEKITDSFGMNMNPSSILSMLEDYMERAIAEMDIDTEPAMRAASELFSHLGIEMLTQYISEHCDPETGETVLRLSDVETIVTEYLSTASAQAQMRKLEAEYTLPEGTFQPVCCSLFNAMLTDYISSKAPAPEIPDSPEFTEPTIPQEPEETQPVIPETESYLPETEAEEPVGISASAHSGFSQISNDTPEDSREEMLPEVTEPVIPDISDPSVPDETEPVVPDETLPVIPDETEPAPDIPSLPDYPQTPDIDLEQIGASIYLNDVESVVGSFMEQPLAAGVCAMMGTRMMLPAVQEILQNELAGFISVLMRYVGNSFSVDEEMLASAFQFNMDEAELQRLMEVMSGGQTERSAQSNLKNLGYANMDEPVGISVYFIDFAAKEHFIFFLDSYNEDMENAGYEDQVIRYTDVTSIMMSSVRTIIDSVSYVLIAFVAVSLIVSSIMIGIITYISVMERTKEIGVLRAIGASKRNISQVFNAETFIIGLCSGLLGIGVTLVTIIPINQIIYSLTDNPNINAQLPVTGAISLIILSMVLTLIGGLIPAKHAAKKDPVIALRSE